jgi:hypothetical protein
METLPFVFSSGWASGVNAYAVVLLMGMLGRFAGVDGIPPALERTDVLVAAAVLFALEFVADKIPYVDSLWDTVSTLIRPTVGAAVGALIAGEAGDLNQAVAAATGGLTAFLSHTVKAGVRMAVNTSPEPASNIAVSTAEDFTVAGMVILAVSHPWLAASIAAVLLVFGVTLVLFLASRIRRFLRRRRERAVNRSPGAGV